MKIIYEQSFNTDFAKSEASEAVFVRVDVDAQQTKKLSPQAIPILHRTAHDFAAYRPHFIDDICQQYTQCAKALQDLGFSHLALGFDQDGALQKWLSPRFNQAEEWLRIKPLVSLYENIKRLIPMVTIFLTVEELAPGGMDLTQGIGMAQSLEALGLTDLVVASGTQDFPWLYDRRPTTQKKNEPDFSFNDPELGSAVWIKQNTHLNIWPYLQNPPEQSTIATAQTLGFSGLVVRK